MGVAFLLVAIAIFFTSPSSSSDSGVRVDLTHIDAGKGYSRAELLQRAAERSRVRAAKLSGISLGPVAVHPSLGEYLLDLAIGTPPMRFTAILDTGSDLIWTQCYTCMRCIPQPSPFFNPFRSSSYSALPCTHQLCLAVGDASCAPNCIYHYRYGDNTDTIGFMGNETFTFGSGPNKARIPQVAFGCGLYNGGNLQNSSGIVGFGLGPLSLVSQLSATRFSYCFTEGFQDESPKSPLFIGTKAKLTGAGVRSTPLLPVSQSFRLDSTFYYLSLKGITVGPTRLPIPPETFQVKQDGSGGVIIDSGTSFLHLHPVAYEQFVGAFKSQIKEPSMTLANFELCYRKLPATVPRLVFHFEGADWELPSGNYLLGSAPSDQIQIHCLAVKKASDLSIFGNVQTQNMHVLYDLKKKMLSFKPTTCSKL